MKKSLLDFLVVASPKVLGGAATLGLNFVLLRFFGPAQFGIYSLCVAAILLSDAVLGSALDFGVLRLAPSLAENRGSHSAEVQRAALAIKFTAAVFVSVLLVAFAGTIGRFLFHSDGNKSLVYLTCGTVVMLLLFRSAQVQLQVEGRFRAYAALDLFHIVLKFGAVGIGLILSWVGVGKTLTVFALAPALVFVGWALTYGKPLLGTFTVRFSAVKELLSFVKWFLLTFALANMIVRMDLFLLTRWSRIEQVGVYSAGQVFAFVPQLLGIYLAVILSPRIMPYHESGQLAGFFRRYYQLAFLAGVAIYIAARIGVMTVGPWLLPNAFNRSADIILILLPGAVAGFLLFPVAIPVLMFLRPKFLFAMDAIALPFLLIAYRIVIPKSGAEGAAWVTSSYSCAKSAIALVVAWRCTRREREVGIPLRTEEESATVFSQKVEALEGGTVL